MRHMRRKVALVLAAAALAIALAACGGASGSDETNSEPMLYTNAVHGFTLYYSKPLGVVTMDPPAGEVYSIAFADKKGTLVDDKLANGLRVSVLELDKAMKPADIKKYEEGITQAVKEIVADFPEGKTTGEVSTITLNGTPAFVVDYEATISGEPAVGRLYTVIKGDKEFRLTLQAVKGDWERLEPVMEKAAQSFTLD